MKKCFLIVLLVFLTVLTIAQSNGNKEVYEGNKAFQKGDYQNAVDLYNEALKINPQNEYAKVNKAIAFNKANKNEEAEKAYNEALKTVKDLDLKSRINYNKGVNVAREEKYKEAVEDFKSALRNAPTDTQARENLQLALNKLKQEQQKNQQQDKDQDQQNQPENQDKNQQQPNEGDRNNNMSKEQAERYLDNLREEEKNLQQKIMKRSAGEGQQENKRGW